MSQPETPAPFVIPAPIAAHRGFAVTRHRETETDDGVAFSTTVSYQGRSGVTGRNQGNGGADMIDYATRDVEKAFMALADGSLMDSDSQEPCITESDILEVLISTYEAERRSVENTLIRSDVASQDRDTLSTRDEYLLKGHPAIDVVRATALESDPPCTQWYRPGIGWVDLAEST